MGTGRADCQTSSSCTLVMITRPAPHRQPARAQPDSAGPAEAHCLYRTIVPSRAPLAWGPKIGTSKALRHAEQKDNPFMKWSESCQDLLKRFIQQGEPACGCRLCLRPLGIDMEKAVAIIGSSSCSFLAGSDCSSRQSPATAPLCNYTVVDTLHAWHAGNGQS